MGCYYHPAVPTAVLCRACGHEICAHCAVDSLCPGCRLGQAIKGAAARQPVLVGTVAGNGSWNASANGPRASSATRPAQSAAATAPPPTVSVVDTPASPEDRLLAALSYPLWPVALLVLLLRRAPSQFLRFNVVQSLAVNALGVALYMIYAASANFPVIGWQAAFALPFAVPVWFLVDVYLGIKAYGGQLFKVPIASDIASKYAA